MKTVIMLGTFSTKGEEYAFLRKRFMNKLNSIAIDTSTKGQSLLRLEKQDIDSITFFKQGGHPIDKVRTFDRGSAIKIAESCAQLVILNLYKEKKVDGIIALGGSAGTTIATSAMRVLPYGIPKLMISTLANGDTKSYVGISDIIMMPSICDISGLNRFSNMILSNAACSMLGMLTIPPDLSLELTPKFKPLIAMTMFGVTTPCVTAIQKQLTEKNYECIVFHATGTGGRIMEKMIEEGYFTAVCDITTTEWADEVVGGIFSAGPTRLEAAIKKGLPQIISVGALDMVNFGPRHTVPEKFQDRLFYEHNSNTTLMRTTKEECIEIGKKIAEKLNQAKMFIKVYFPLKGVSEYDKTDHTFNDLTARNALFMSLRDTLKSELVELKVLDCHINDPEFAETVTKDFISLINNNKPSQPSRISIWQENHSILFKHSSTAESSPICTLPTLTNTNSSL